MQTLTHQNLLIEGMVSIHRITDVRMNVTKNEHAKLFIRGIAMDDEELGDITDQLLSPTLGSKFTLYRYEEDKKTPIFSGFIENVNLVEDKGIDYFEVEVVSASILFDRKKQKRSFQNVSMTYEELALQIVSEYDAGATICTVGGDTAIGTPMIQYNETDWEFLKRLASHFESPIYPEYTHCLPRVWFGFPNQMSMVDISEYNYIYGQDQSYFEIINNDNDMDFRYIETESYDNFEIGSGTNFRNRVYSLYQKYGIMDNGELIFTYRFGSNGLKQAPKFYNDIISGMSLLGEVAKDDKEDVYVKLDIDNGGGGAYPYPFRPETGNMMYCMPQVGTIVSLYFPNFDEKNAMVVNCFRTNGEDCTDMSDPSKRAFNTEHGKCMALHSRTMSLSSTSGSSILLDDDNGLMLNSAKSIKFYAEGGLYLNAHRVNFKAREGEILALKMDAAMEVTKSSVSMCSRFDIKGKNGTILKGTVFVHYEPFDDAPMEKGFDVWELVGNVLAGLVAVVVVATIVVAVAGAVVLTGGASLAVAAGAAVSIGKGALIGGVIAVGVTAGIDVWNKEVSSTAEYVFAGATGAITGAIGTGLSTLKFAKLAKFSKSFKLFNTTLKIGGDDLAIAALQVGEGVITGAGESIVSQMILEGKTWEELNWYDVGFNSLINGGIGFLAPNIVSGTKTIGGAIGGEAFEKAFEETLQKVSTKLDEIAKHFADFRNNNGGFLDLDALGSVFSKGTKEATVEELAEKSVERAEKEITEEIFENAGRNFRAPTQADIDILNQIRLGGSNNQYGTVGNKRNVAFATGEINGKNITLESISGGTNRGNFAVPENNHYTGGPWPDNVHHTEQNMIEFLRNEYADTIQGGTSPIVGKIEIVSDFEICDNCNWIIDSFQNEFQNIDIIRIQVRPVP